MRHWFKDQHFRSLLKNSSYLGASRLIAAACGLATFAFAGRGLGILLVGTLVLISGSAGMSAVAVLRPLSGPWIGIGADALWLAMLYCTVLPTMGAATP